MTLFKEKALLIGRVPQKYEFCNALYTQPLQEPLDGARDRMILFGLFKGYGGNLTSSFVLGFAVYDFDNDANQWRLTKFNTGFSTWYWVRGSALINSTQIMSPYDPSSANAYLAKSLATVASDGTVTLNYEATQINSPTMPFNFIELFGTPAVGYNGALLVSYYRAKFINGYGTTNGFVDKLTPTVYTLMSGAVCTGYTGAESSQGQPCLNSAMLGGTSPNGYIVTDAARGDASTVARYALVNCTGAPSAVTNVSFAGTSHGLISFSPTSVVATYSAKFTILYTNSATAPTTLTQGAAVDIPDPPAGYGFDAADVDAKYSLGDFVASNYYVGDNKTLVFVLYKLLSSSTLADGDTNYYVILPFKLTSTGTSNLVATFPTEDIHGLTTQAITYTTEDPFENYATTCIGCGNDKATWLFRDYNSDKLIQQTFQL